MGDKPTGNDEAQSQLTSQVPEEKQKHLTL